MSGLSATPSADLSQHLIEQVLSAAADARPLNLCGRGSKAFMGRVAESDQRDGAAPELANGAKAERVELAQHSGIVSYKPEELVISVRAGTSVKDITEVLAERQQTLAFEPPCIDADASIGGTLACNLSGPARPWSGSVRDRVIGIRLINGKGEHLRFGGKVIKNVAGYDVARLQAGAMGTLGIITEVSLRVSPSPSLTHTYSQQMGAAEALKLMNQLAAQPWPISGACWVDHCCYLRFAGAGSAVKQAAKEVAKLTGAAPSDTVCADQPEQHNLFWRKLADQHLDYFQRRQTASDQSAPRQPLWRFSIKPTAPLIQHLGDESDWLLDWGGAQRWLRGDYVIDELRQLAQEAGGQVHLFRGGDRQGEVFHPLSAALQQLQLNLKQAFDPQRLFNPGRLYSWL